MLRVLLLLLLELRLLWLGLGVVWWLDLWRFFIDIVEHLQFTLLLLLLRFQRLNSLLYIFIRNNLLILVVLTSRLLLLLLLLLLQLLLLCLNLLLLYVSFLAIWTKGLYFFDRLPIIVSLNILLVYCLTDVVVSILRLQSFYFLIDFFFLYWALLGVFSF